jgi:uncharacterized protein (DUF952 family)
MVRVVYKICPTPLWREAERAAVFAGSDVDRGMASSTFQRPRKSPRPPESILPVNTTSFWSESMPSGSATALKWEPSRGGALFPHLHGNLDLAAVTRVEPLPLGPDGLHVFPALED